MAAGEKHRRWRCASRNPPCLWKNGALHHRPENGRRKRITKLDAAVTQLANDAARGDKKSIQLAFCLLQVLEPRIEEQRLLKENEPADEAVLAELKSRLLCMGKGAAEADE